jgi:hypothetical protein
MTDWKLHWQATFESKLSDHLTWYQPHLALSLELIQATGLSKDASILDVGGGDSTLVDDLLELGFSSLTVLDICALALRRSQARLAARAAGNISVICSDYNN